tara:strand:- start:487 stop:1065 length:579 start_codon:yes stop_codon:yes gene_type:complete
MNNINYIKKDRKIFISYISKEYNISENVLQNKVNNISHNIDITHDISYISKEYNISENVLKDIFEKLFNNKSSISNFNINKCIAIIENGNQCSCSKNTKYGEGTFCKTHYNLYENNCLKYGYININNLNIQSNLQNKLMYSQQNNNKTELEYMKLNSKDYLYNPITKKVYDYKTKKKIGKLNKKLEIVIKNT